MGRTAQAERPLARLRKEISEDFFGCWGRHSTGGNVGVRDQNFLGKKGKAGRRNAKEKRGMNCWRGDRLDVASSGLRQKELYTGQVFCKTRGGKRSPRK